MLGMYYLAYESKEQGRIEEEVGKGAFLVDVAETDDYTDLRVRTAAWFCEHNAQLFNELSELDHAYEIEREVRA